MKDTSVIYPTVALHSGDLPPEVAASIRREEAEVAVDIETTGLSWSEDTIQLVSLFCPRLSEVHLVRTTSNTQYKPPLLIQLMEEGHLKKILHHAMFDLRFMRHHWGSNASNVACTKIASKLTNKRAKSHSLSALVLSEFKFNMDKSVAVSDWAVDTLTTDQLEYAANDVVFLPSLLDRLLFKALAVGAEKVELLEGLFTSVPFKVQTEVLGYNDIYAH